MTQFPAQWHHLAVEDSLNSLSYPPRFTSCSFPSPFCKRFLSGHFFGFTNILRQQSQCGSPSIFYFSPSSSTHSQFLPHTFTTCLSLSVPLPPSLLSVRHWQLRSSGALRGAEKTKIWFSGSDLDFLQIGWKIRRSFYSYTTHFPCNCKPWLQTTGVAAISTNVPSVTRRLCVFYLKPWIVGEHNVLNIGPRETDVKCRMGKGGNKGTMQCI